MSSRIGTETPTGGPVSMRKKPQQARSRQRLDRILEVSVQAIEEKGLPALSIRDIARRADINIATFYQFFPNRGALIRALTERFMGETSALLERAIEQAGTKPLENAVADILESMFAYFLHNPAYLEVWYGGQADPVLRALNQRDTEENARVVERLMVRYGWPEADERTRSTALILVILSSQVFRNAAGMDEARRTGLIETQRRLIISTLQSAAANSGPNPDETPV